MTATDQHAGPNRATFWSSRVLRRSLFDADGSTVGSIQDILLSPSLADEAPVLRGFIAQVDRRRIFVHQARVDAVGRDGVHLRGGTVDLRRFEPRAGELMVAEDIVGTATDQGTITDVGFTESTRQDGTWVVHAVATEPRGRLRRRPVQTLPWSAVASRYQTDAVAGDLARLHDLHKADAAAAIRALSAERRAELAAALDASRLADVLEELPEDEQVAIIAQLETDAAVAVLEEMETDDEIDLLQEMSPSDRELLLAEMEPEQVALLRSLLTYHEDTAGGMMTPEAIILAPDTSVAEAIARLRDTDLPPALTVRVFVVEPPTTTPTGRFLGAITMPRLLKEPPSHTVEDAVDTQMPTLAPSSPVVEVANTLARYDLLAVPVLDPARRLVGVVTVDDVLLRLIGSTARR